MSNFNMAKEEIPSGAIIGNRYLIQTILGQGGLGRTYLAFDVHRFNEPCVLKEFAPFGSGQYDLEKSCALFKREAEILHCITHPQIPKFLACFEIQGRLFLVQEFVNGKTYSALLQERQRNNQAFSESEVVRWLIDILPILDYLHERGIIHRDISPDNIMQPEAKELPVLIDFGVGKLTNGNLLQESGKFGRATHSYVGKMSFVGKIGYAAIEQISMGKSSPSSDLYSLGVTALVLLTGKDPTGLLNQDSLEWEWQKYVKVRDGFAKFISKMTESRPLRRYQSAKEALKDLETHCADLDTLIQKNNQEKHNLFNSQKKLVTTKRNQRKQALGAKQTELKRNTNSEEETIILELSQPQSSPKKKQPPHSQQSPLSKQQQNGNNFEDTIIVSPSPNNLSASKSLELSSEPESKSKILEPEFIKVCHEELAYFIGPIANLIIEETLGYNHAYSPESFVETLAQQIPNVDLRNKFKERLSILSDQDVGIKEDQ